MIDRTTGITTEWIILADHAEVNNGKLYLMGGGWETVTVNQEFPTAHPCGIAVAFFVPWSETNQAHPVAIEALDADGESLIEIEAELEVARPPGMPLGSGQRVPIAVNLTLQLERAGTYRVTTRIHAQASGSVDFNVVEGPGLGRARPKKRRAD